MDQQVDSPDLIGIEVDLRLVLQLPVRFVAAHRVTHFREPAANRLYTDLELQIARDFAAWRSVQNHKERSDTHVGMRPESNDARPHALAFDDRERRTVVGARRKHKASK